jgi:transposase
MQVVHELCAGLDVHKKSLFAGMICLDSNGSKHVEVRSYGTVTRELLKLLDWLRENQITHVAMEATGVYRRPAWAVLEGQSELMLVNPHRIADLLQHGLIRGSFVLPVSIQDLRDLTRYRQNEFGCAERGSVRGLQIC